MKNVHLIPTDKPSSKLQKTKYGNFFLSNEIKSYSDCTNQNIYITNDEEIKEGDWVYCNIEGFEPVLKQKVNPIGVNNDSFMKKIILTTDLKLIIDGVQAIDDTFLEWFVKNPTCEEVEVDIEKYVNLTSNPIPIYKIIIPKENYKQLFTDYPITELGDKEFVEAPIRPCELISYDDNKYCYVRVEGIEIEIKRCYIYPKKGRCDEVDCISIEEIKELLKDQETIEEAAEIFYSEQSKSYEDAIEPIFDNSRYLVAGFIDGAKWQQERSYSEEEVLKSADYLGFKQITSEELNSLPYQPFITDEDGNIWIIDKNEWYKQFKKK
jgi:hypothetical protein